MIQKRSRFLGTLTLGDNTYDRGDIIGIMPKERFGMKSTTYGGRISNLGVTKAPGLYIVLEKMQPIDLFVDDFMLLPVRVLKDLCKYLSVPLPKKVTKAEIVKAMGYDVEEEEEDKPATE